MLLRGTSSPLAPLALPSFFDCAEVTGASVIFSGTGGVTNTAAARMAMAVVQEGFQLHRSGSFAMSDDATALERGFVHVPGPIDDTTNSHCNGSGADSSGV